MTPRIGPAPRRDAARSLHPALARAARPAAAARHRRRLDLERGARGAQPPGGAAAARRRPGARRPAAPRRPDRADFVVAYLGALRVGLVVVPANTAYREREVAHIVGDAGPRGGRGRRPGAAAAGSRRRGRRDLLVVGPEVDLPDGDPSRRSTPPARTTRPCSCYTSGTTGAPKGARADPRQPAGQRRGAPPRLALGARRPAGAGPAAVPHPRPRGRPPRHARWPAPRPCCCPRFDADAVLDAARASEATLFFGVPTMYARLAASPRAAELGRLRLCVSGSAPLPPTVFERLAERSGAAGRWSATG